ncbi:tetratricopeptide repeat protein [Pararhodonellum marinum]|uniref:tetratricopeptide repeat protein n=1 Tax=Pararhodonellum marinum TaxID=2755358 RepID=UPI00293B90F1|nr:tetratricopeptide repeat protein [Pararhodonellum marinum]
MRYCLGIFILVMAFGACSPTDEELFQEGVKELESGDYPKSISYFDRLIERDAQNTSALNAKGVAYFEMQEWDKAIEAFNASIQLDSTSYKPFFNRGNAYLEKKEYGKAVVDYNFANGLDPQQGDIYYNRGLALLGMESYEDAIFDFDIVLQGTPDFAQAHFNKGKAQLGNNEPIAALESLIRSTDLDPRNGAAYYLLGVTELSVFGDEKKIDGCAHLNKALSLGFGEAKSWIDEFCKE